MNGHFHQLDSPWANFIEGSIKIETFSYSERQLKTLTNVDHIVQSIICYHLLWLHHIPICNYPFTWTEIRKFNNIFLHEYFTSIFSYLWNINYNPNIFFEIADCLSIRNANYQATKKITTQWSALGNWYNSMKTSRCDYGQQSRW